MGGFGSGRRWSGKDTTLDFRRLDVRGLQRGGWLAAGASFVSRWSRNGVEQASIQGRSESDRVVLSYRHQSHGQDWESLEYSILLERTRCNYGGTRTWFLCPGLRCGRRVAVLYAGKYFVCRHCRELAYESQREPRHDRLLSRLQDLNAKLGGSGCTLDGMPNRPKGMHLRTYQRIAARYEWLEKVMDMETVRRFGFTF